MFPNRQLALVAVAIPAVLSALAVSPFGVQDEAIAQRVVASAPSRRQGPRLVPYRPGQPVLRQDDPVGAALAYLRREMDVFHNRSVVYDDLESGGVRFIPSGWMRGPDETWSPRAVSRLSITHSYRHPRSGVSCLRIHWRPERDDEWTGVYFQYPDDNWGEFQGHDLSCATHLTFWARGDTGCEVVEFKFGGINCNRRDESDHPTGESRPCNYVDSTDVISTGSLTLSRQWKRYCLDLRSRNLRNIAGGFVWVASALPNDSRGIVTYIDDVNIHHSRLSEPRLIRSYYAGTDPLTDKGNGVGVQHLRNACYTYDNALAISAFLASREQEDSVRARLIADAFVLLASQEMRQSRHSTFAGWRLRNAYSCGDLFDVKATSGETTLTARFPGKVARRGTGMDSVDIESAKKTWQQDTYSLGIDTGNMAWAILALLNVWDADGKDTDSRYLLTARRLAQWILTYCDARHPPNVDQASAEKPLGFGFRGGAEWDMDKESLRAIEWHSSEHNIDLIAVFRRLAAAESPGSDEQRMWESAERSAMAFVTWARSGRPGEQDRLVTGTKIVDGRIELALTPKPLDLQTWAPLAMPEKAQDAAFINAINWALRNCRVTTQADLSGYTFATHKDPWKQNDDEVYASTASDVSEAGSDIWPEGTAQMALALLAVRGNPALDNEASYESVMADLDRILAIRGQQVASIAMPAAYPDIVHTGFFVQRDPKVIHKSYFNLAHVGATAWYVMAKLRYSPFYGTEVETQLPAAGE